MFRSTLLLATAAFAAVASAQNYSTSGNLSVDTSQIPSALKSSWCRAQTNSCPQICGGRASPNNCDSNTLTYQCVCTDGSSPNISDYDQTIPSFVCQTWVGNCVDAHPNDLDGQTGCRSVTCGSRNASSNLAATTSSAATTSATASSSSSAESTSASGTPTGSSASTTATTSSAAMALHVAEQYGTGIIAGGLLALFGLVL
ncbi:hypothetical protein M409DRAFT_23199 [Zasmidium cellare ATCC 36951]|uniref:DUF7707 domain-containing protein n=1 Tax=Zasmidium cellare ATCC 36951 TaxID=1080233 RepID=A0A6A6CH95_ZASCE|nr:uncharacterized protein M409DRAFT_23199 [Zasmidium cellare ATCC 36951]KAF2166564.1 hypothetical protein M409DRAFT_23199 [Zasmidium cellare ATCC 36951]